METIEFSHPPLGEPTVMRSVALAPALAPTSPDASGQDTYAHCDECGSLVEQAQRYCVQCGAHRTHVNDPAARYIGQATIRARNARATPGTRRAGRRTFGLGAALVIAAIPVAAAVGVEVGRSSNNGDQALISALSKHSAAIAAGASTTAASGTSASSAPSTAATTTKATTTGHTAKRSGKSSSSTKGASAVRSTGNGSASQITSAKPTAAQDAQGEAAAKQVQSSTGKGYVNTQNNLPSSVVVP